MPARPTKPTRRSIGRPVQWSEEELAQLAAVSPADVKAAQALWHNDAPRRFTSLLEASVIEKEKKQA